MGMSGINHHSRAMRHEECDTIPKNGMGQRIREHGHSTQDKKRAHKSCGNADTDQNGYLEFIRCQDELTSK